VSCPDLIRASIDLHKKPFPEADGLPGHRRAEAMPSFGRLCPAMTGGNTGFGLPPRAKTPFQPTGIAGSPATL
jgi:hypothetical protein